MKAGRWDHCRNWMLSAGARGVPRTSLGCSGTCLYHSWDPVVPLSSQLAPQNRRGGTGPQHSLDYLQGGRVGSFLGAAESQAAQWAQCPANPGPAPALTVTPTSARGDEAPPGHEHQGLYWPLPFSRTPLASCSSRPSLFLPLLDHPRSCAPPRKTNTSSHLGAYTVATTHPTPLPTVPTLVPRKPVSTGFWSRLPQQSPNASPWLPSPQWPCPGQSPCPKLSGCPQPSPSLMPVLELGPCLSTLDPRLTHSLDPTT